MSVFSNINKIAKSFYNNVLNMGEESFKIGKTLKSEENILEINPNITLSFWDNSVSYNKNDRVFISVVNSDNDEIYKIYKAKNDVKSDVSPETDTQNWEESKVQISNLPEGMKKEVFENTNQRHTHKNKYYLEQIENDCCYIQYKKCTSEDEVARLNDGMYYVVLETTSKPSTSVGGLVVGGSSVTTYSYFWIFAKGGASGLVGSSTHTQTRLFGGEFYKRYVTIKGRTVEYTAWELLGNDTYATQKELENYVKKDDYSGINSLSYFFADNLNNGLFGAIETSGALMCDYIFKNNSMSEIEIDLKNCVSMVGGFLNSTVEKVTFTNGTAKLQKANNLFRGCTKMIEVKGLDLTNCDSVKYMFMNCESLTSLAAIDTNAIDFSYAFMNCKTLEEITLKAPNLQLATGMFTGCDSLKTVTINESTDYEKLFNALPTVESGNITVDNNVTISESIKKIATDKGWTI